MKYSLLCFVFCLISWQHSIGQRYDYNWLTGYNTTIPNPNWGGSGINFNLDTLSIIQEYREMNLHEANYTMSDSAGNIIFYTNGCDIADKNNNIMLNGNNINPDGIHNIQCDQNLAAYPSGTQSLVALPLPETYNVYYLFHKRITYSAQPFDVITNTLFYSVIDMKESGFGLVTQKNVPLLQDTLEYGAMTAVRHANGHDWWLVTPRANSNQFYNLLFTKEGVTSIIEQTIGNVTNPLGAGGGQVIFSPDGSQYIRYNPASPLQVYEFDRNLGQFISYQEIEVNYNGDSHNYGGVAVSPSGRYLYLSAHLNIFQFDLQSSDITSSQTLIAHYDGFADPLPSTFAMCQLAPDCKIYILTGQITKYYHVIHSPDQAGEDCNFEARGLEFPTYHGGALLMAPNYRLGPIDSPGSPCSSVLSSDSWLNPLLPTVSVFPNPASDHLQLVFNHSLPLGTQALLFNKLGQRVKTMMISTQSATSFSWPLYDLPAGMYWLVVISEGEMIQKKPVVIVR